MRGANAFWRLLLVVGCLLPTAATVLADTNNTEDFSSYPDNGSPPFGCWTSDVPYTPLPDNGAWHITSDSGVAPTFGKFIQTHGLPSQTTNHWLACTTTDIAPIQQASIQFDYVVQTNTDLLLSVGEGGPFTSVPFMFTKRENGGQIQDSTGVINLTPYLSGTSSTLVVRLDSSTTGSAFSQIRLDNFNVTTVVPEPAALGVMVVAGMMMLQNRRRGGRARLGA